MTAEGNRARPHALPVLGNAIHRFPHARGLPELECQPGLDPKDCGKKFPRMNTYVTLNGHRLVDSIVLTNGLKFSPLRMPA